MPDTTLLLGVHPVREALRAGRTLNRLLVARGASGAKLQEIIDLCRQAAIPVRFVARDELDRLSGNAVHQGIVAVGASHAYSDLGDVLGRDPLLVLDGVEDPHNLGAIVRTAHAAGAAAIMIPERRAAGLTETAAKAAAGALEYLPVVRVGNISRALEELKRAGYWIYGLDERGDALYHQVDYVKPTVLVLGGEGRGLHQHVRGHCDFLIRIPMAGPIASLNVSVAAGVVLFEWRRRQASAASS
jgi:23S rRNA (guanosine2251-2'-O)-methyltransferase